MFAELREKAGNVRAFVLSINESALDGGHSHDLNEYCDNNRPYCGTRKRPAYMDLLALASVRCGDVRL